jgi:hypothetical protein
VRLGKSEDLYVNLQMGTPCQFLIGDFGRVPPREIWSKEYKLDLAAVAPEDSRSLYHVLCVVVRVGLIDDTGRRWWVHPGRGGRAKRVYGDFGRKWKPPWPTAPERFTAVLEVPSITRDDGRGDAVAGTANGEH